MPIMNGFETLDWIKANRPELKVLILSMNDEESNIIKAVRNGANGYLLKNTTPANLKLALSHVIENGFYHSEIVSNGFVKQRQCKSYQALWRIERT